MLRVKIETSGASQSKRLHRPVALWLFLAAIIVSLFTASFAAEHSGPPQAWEHVSALLQTRDVVVEKRGVGMQRFGSRFLQESYLAQWQGQQIVCTWQTAILPGFADLGYAMSKSQDGFRPLHSMGMIGLDPENRGRCRPESGWSNFAFYEFATLLSLIALSSTLAIILWRRN